MIHDNMQQFWNDPEIILLKKTKFDSLILKDGHLAKKTLTDHMKELLPGKKADNSSLVAARLIQIIKKTNEPKAKAWIFRHHLSQMRDAKLIHELKKGGILKKDVENIINPNLARLRDRKDSSDEVARRLEKALLAEQLGVSPTKNKGQTGTALVESTKGKVAVFKPIHSDTPMTARCKNAVKRIFGGQLHYLSHKTNAQAEAEVAAYLLDRHFDFGLSPASQMVTLDGKEGALQVFIKSKDETPFKEAADHIDAMEAKEVYTEQEVALFQKMAIFDYLIGNLDRHEENWFVKVVNNEITEIRTIDNANSFLRKNPESADKIRNQYKWRRFKIAEVPLTASSKAFIQEQLKSENIDAFVTKLNTELPGFLDKEMTNQLYDRAEVLRKAATEKNFIPRDLGLLITSEDIFNYLKFTK
ncbi:MAG: hypothetical protein LLF94_06395 [Chlamydiales bacterium]|nr:hypothetical protein [Chlamydiales bacterium]